LAHWFFFFRWILFRRLLLVIHLGTNCPPCKKICGKTLNCKNHTCEALCHTGKCQDCPKTIVLTCFCGGESKEVNCQVGYDLDHTVTKSCRGGHKASVWSGRSESVRAVLFVNVLYIRQHKYLVRASHTWVVRKSVACYWSVATTRVKRNVTLLKCVDESWSTQRHT